MQATHTAHGVELAAVAAACGFPTTGTLREEPEVEPAPPAIARSSTSPRSAPLLFVLPPKDGAHLKDRFRRALLENSEIAS